MIIEILARTALSPSKLPGLDYALNPYMGCCHACVYCYAPGVLHRDRGTWTRMIEAKVNLPRLLSKELKRKKKGVVGLGTVTDPYQPVEKKYEITRRCLELLQMHDFPVCIQTKSSLILRDMDLLKKFSNIEVGITLTALDERIREKMEPGASSVKERLMALSELSKNNISTWVFLGPVMPYITDAEGLIDAIVKPKYVLIDRLRLKEGVWEGVKKFVQELNPELLEMYDRIFLEGEDYYGRVFKKIIWKCRTKGMKCEMNK
jgi:DNA repair photolyase